MKKIIRQVSPVFIALVFVSGAFTLMSSTKKAVKQTAPAAWVAPKEADAVKNPTKDNAESVTKGKKIYNQMCTVCHGNKGKGDGPGGLALKPKPTDHTSAKFHAQSDGAIYWKLTEGKGSMASYKKSLTEAQRWDLVSYMRELGAKK